MSDVKDVKADAKTDAAEAKVKAKETTNETQAPSIEELQKQIENLKGAQSVEAKKRAEAESQLKQFLDKNEDKVDKAELEKFQTKLELSNYKADLIAESGIDSKFFKVIKGDSKEEIKEAIETVKELQSNMQTSFEKKAEEAKVKKIPVPQGNTAPDTFSIDDSVNAFVEKTKSKR